MKPAASTRLLSDPLIVGTICGVLSSIGYTASNICLRAVSDVDPAWVSCIKAIPTTVMFAPWFFVLARQGRRIIPKPGQLVSLAAAGLFGQLGGNVMFQAGLEIIGLALMVPLTLGGMILSGAVLGRIFLNEPVTLRAAISMLVLIVAVAVLSLGADKAYQQLHEIALTDAQVKGTADDARHQLNEFTTTATATITATQWLKIAGGVSGALFAGFSYSVLGVVIRRNVTQGVPLTVAVVTVSLVGMISLGLVSLVRIGPEIMFATTDYQWVMMALAGISNAVAFLALSMALKSTPILYVNAINASQAAMAAAAGLFFFSEPLSWSLMIGVVLTMVGLVLTERRSAKNPLPPNESESLSDDAAAQ